MKRKVFHKIIKGISLISIIGILLAYLSVFINPEKFGILPFFGLFYPYFFFVNLAFFIFWIFRKNKLAIWILLVLILGWNQVRATFQIAPHKKALTNHTTTTTGKQIKLLSYNVHLFRSLKSGKKPSNTEELINFIFEKHADIICLQEVYFSGYSGVSRETLSKKLHETPYSFIHTEGSTRHYGLAIYSAFPIINQGTIKFNGTSNSSIYADIVIKKDTIRIFNNHLQSFLLGSKNFDFLTTPPVKNDETLEEIQDISFRMVTAFKKRAGQTRRITKEIKSTPYPVIVCGDFNDTPVSYTYHKFTKDLNDAFVKSGKGFGKTYAKIFPSYRIDYILFSPSIHSENFQTIRSDYSDHFPVFSTLSVKEKS